VPEAVLFAGPSAWGLPPACLRDPAIAWRPPVRRGDVDRLVGESATPGVIIVCDGVFKVAAAVSHQELCVALDAGWQVWGVSSLGAIRAHELRHEGMLGFGVVHAMFDRFEDFTDDEMCLLHFPEPPYFPLSEPLVNLRHALDRRGRDLGISRASIGETIGRLRALWFGDRTEQRIRSIMVGPAGVDEHRVTALLEWLRRHRAKTTDLQRLLTTRPWREGAVRGRTP
jgi:hypothetical protein